MRIPNLLIGNPIVLSVPTRWMPDTRTRITIGVHGKVVMPVVLIQKLIKVWYMEYNTLLMGGLCIVLKIGIGVWIREKCLALWRDGAPMNLEI